MFNRQKTLAHQLLVKLQDQLLASQLVVNTLLDEFSNIDNIYESYKPTIPSAVQLLKTNSESLLPFLGDALKWLSGTATTRDTWEIKVCKPINKAHSKQQKTLVNVISILSITRYAAQVNSIKIE